MSFLKKLFGATKSPTPAAAGSIHDAVRAGDLERVKKLLMGRPKLVSSKDNGGWTPLHWAADKGHQEVAQWLLFRKADVNADYCYDPENNLSIGTPMHLAALNGHTDIVELLRKHGGHE